MKAQIPIFLAQECERDGLCSTRRVEKGGRIIPTCADCGKRIPNFDFAQLPEDAKAPVVYRNMGGRGFQSFTWDHEHILSTDVGMLRGAAYRELCLDCKNEDFKKRYPVNGNHHPST